MPDDAHLSTAAKTAALLIVQRLRARYGLPEIERDDLYRIAGYIDDAIKDANALTSVLRGAGLPSTKST